MEGYLQDNKENQQRPQHPSNTIANNYSTMEGEDLTKSFHRMNIQDGSGKSQAPHQQMYGQQSNYSNNNNNNKRNNNKGSHSYNNNNNNNSNGQKFIRKDRGGHIEGESYSNQNNSRNNGGGNNRYEPRRRNYDNQHNNNGAGSREHGQSTGSKSQGYPSSNGYSSGHYNNRRDNNNNGSNTTQGRPKRNFPPNPDPNNPFCFDISDRDMEVCERTAEVMKELYSNIKFETEILAKIQQLAVNAEKFLQFQQQNVTDFYEDKRKHEINAWLATCSEEEQKRYWERIQKS